jgi:hypothetical protein
MYSVVLNQVLSYKSTNNLRTTNFCPPSEIKYEPFIKDEKH